MGVRITGIGAYTPQRIVNNHDIAARVDTSHEWILAKTGIRERRVAGPDENASDLAEEAAARALVHAGVPGEQVDLVVVACATPDQSQPAVACLVQEKLGIAESRCPAFDVNSVCAGFVYALNVAQGMMLGAPDQYRHALVIGADAFSKILDWSDRRTCVFFGDAAGAVVLSRTQGDERLDFLLGADGRGSAHIQVPAGGTRIPVTQAVLDARQNKFTMNGPKVWEFAVDTVPRNVRALLSRHGLEPRDLDLLILHQSNLRMIEAIMASLELPMERTFTTVQDYGNTAAASIPLTLQKASEAGVLSPGSRVLVCGFGGGLSWGSALIEW